jgi:predicted O-methyltransferase YrrM
MIGIHESVLKFVGAMTRETEVQRRLRETTAPMPHAEMQISPDVASFLALLVKTCGARRAIEVGTFTGYSALAIASALPPDGQLIACDVSDEYTRVGKPFWAEAGVASRIDLRLGPADETLQTLLESGQSGRFDFAFIDADKTNYDIYYEQILQLLRPGGLVALDNMLWSGRVADPAVTDADTRALRALNEKIRDDSRVDMVLVTIRDGVMLARKR